jgi:hypothetical protein
MTATSTTAANATMPVAPVTTATTTPGPVAPVRLRRAAGRSAVLAAGATTAVAALGLAAGVPLAVEGEPIPLLGFAQMTLLCTALGVVLAAALRRWAAHPQRTFTVATIALTALSIVPDLIVPATAATRVVLILTHLVAAAIVIPALRTALPAERR